MIVRVWAKGPYQMSNLQERVAELEEQVRKLTDTLNRIVEALPKEELDRYESGCTCESAGELYWCRCEPKYRFLEVRAKSSLESHIIK